MTELLADLSVFYEALQIPLYLYRDKELLAAFPSQAGNFLPPAAYLEQVFSGEHSSPYLPTDFSALFGYLSVTKEPGLLLLLGPVFHLGPSRQDLHQMTLEYHVRPASQEEFSIFIRNIPLHAPRSFGRLLVMVDHFLNPGHTLDAQISLENQTSENILSASVSHVYEQTSLYQTNDSLEHEAILLDIVEHGRVERLADIQTGFFDFRKGTVASTPLRNEKDLMVALVTLLTRAAIRGGLENQLALSLSDQYIQSVELSKDSQELYELMLEALLCFTSQVASRQKDHIANADMNRIITYVRNHPAEPLDVARLAEIFGYNPSYLSARFKKELGFGLSSFIYRTKLEEARQLLTYTGKSLLEISEYLCFSDQAHFQRRFKEQYGITPLQYRKQVQ